MWYPQPVVVPLPFVFESHSITYEDLSARAMWQVIPFNQRAYDAVNEINGFHNDPQYTNGERRFWLMRSLFELVLANKYLELTNTKLLRWFLCLTANDRTLIKKEGGLMPFIQNHPLLQVDGQYVYVKPKTRGNYSPLATDMSSNKYPSFYGASQCHNCRTSHPFGSKKCRCSGIEISESKVCVSEDEKQLDLLPSNVKEELNILTAQNDATVGCTQSTFNTKKTRCTQSYDYGGPAAHSLSYNKETCPHAQCLSELWEDVEKREDTKHFKDTTTQANFSLDMELDMQSPVQRNDCTQNYQEQFYVQVKEADYHSLDQEAMPEYYSFSNASLDHTEWSDAPQSTEAAYNDSVMATKGSTELSDEPSNATMATAANSTDCFSCFGNSFELDSESGAHQVDMRKKHASVYEQQIEEINMGPSLKSKCGSSVSVDQIIDACGDFRACFTSTCATEVVQMVQIKNVATETDLLAVSHEKDTQTVQMATSEKNTITEVCMSDLDVVTEEFIKLMETSSELEQQKSRKASSTPGGDHCKGVGCDCAQRLRRAELRLLALQFVMCQQHCWRRYFTSPLGESTHWGTEGLPDGIAETLNTLQKDYHEMRKRILAGTPLDNLEPLSVDSDKITTSAKYSPESLSFQVLEAHLNSVDCPGSGHRVDEENEETRVLSTNVCQDTEAAMDDTQVDSNKQNKALASLPKPLGTSAEKNPGGIKDPNSSEAWFDAEEELGSPNQDGKMEKLIERKERTGDDESNSSLLCITSLPGSITEREVLLWFEKYNVTNVCISTFSNNMRAAIIYLMSPSDAKAAVKDLNGCSLQGHTVQVVQLCNPTLVGDQPHSTSKSHKEATGDGLRMKGVTYSSSPGGPRCSVDRLTNVCDSPTASGTCVPKHYATMGSFDTVMARLTERHPNVGRQRIVDALLELRAKHQGFLSGLPLRSIVEMTSELLTQASTQTHI